MEHDGGGLTMNESVSVIDVSARAGGRAPGDRLAELTERTRRHLSVPRDLTMIGYDDIDSAAAAAVALTSVVAG